MMTEFDGVGGVLFLAPVVAGDVAAGEFGELDFAAGDGLRGRLDVGGIDRHADANLGEGNFLVKFQVLFLAVAREAALEMTAELEAAERFNADLVGTDGMARVVAAAAEEIAEGDVEKDRVKLGARAEAGKFAPVGGLVVERLAAQFEMLQLPKPAQLVIVFGGNVMQVELPRLRPARGWRRAGGGGKSALAANQFVTAVAEAHHKKNIRAAGVYSGFGSSGISKSGCWCIR